MVRASGIGQVKRISAFVLLFNVLGLLPAVVGVETDSVSAATLSYPALVAADGAASYWRFGEPAGLVAADSVGTRNAFLTSPATRGAGIGGANDGSVRGGFGASSIGLPTGSTNRTLEVWFKKPSLASEPYPLVAWGDVRVSLIENVVSVQTGGVYNTGSTFSWDGNWHALTLVLNEGVASVFVDGMIAGPSWSAGPLSSVQNGISNQLKETFVDELAVYPTALSETQVATHFRSGVSSTACPATPASAYESMIVGDGALASWGFDELPGDNVSHETIGCRHGSYFGANLRQPGRVGVTLGVSGASSGNLGTAVTATGTGYYETVVAIPTAGLPRGAQARSLEFWAKIPESSSPTNKVKWGNLSFPDFGVLGGVGITEPVRVNNDRWHHIVFTFSDSVARMYVDGIASEPKSFDWSDGPGGDPNLYLFGAGTFDHMAVYGTALTGEIVRNHFKKGFFGQCLPSVSSGSYPALVRSDGASSLWRFQETGSQYFVKDEIGCGYGVAQDAKLMGVAGAIVAAPDSSWSVDSTAPAAPGTPRYSSLIVPADGLGLSPVPTPNWLEFWFHSANENGRLYLRYRNLNLSFQAGYVSKYDVGTNTSTYVGGYHPLGDNNWHHIAITMAGGGGRLFLDGVGSSAFPLDLAAGPVGLRKDVINITIGEIGGQSSDVRFDELALYQNGIPSDQTVLAHYRVGMGLSPIPTSTTTSSTSTTTSTTTTTTTVPGAATVKAIRVLGVSMFADATAKSGIVGTFADPVNGATGAFTHEVQDVSAVSKGVEFSMGRLYDSKATKASPLGTAWGSKLFESIALSADPAVIPGTLVWKSGTGTEAEFAPDGSGGFVTPPGSLGVIKSTAGGGWEYVSGTQVVTRFDIAGRKVSSLDRSGQGLTYAYDLAGRLTTVADATGQSTLLAYGTAASNPNKDLLIKVTTSDGRIVKYGYTANVAGKTRLTSVTDVRNKISTYTYDAQGLLISETDPVGNKPFLNSYDAQGRVVWQDDPLGKRSTFAYNDAQQITTMTDAAGAVQSQNYSGNVLGAVSTPAGSSVIGRNAALDVTSYTDADGKSWAAQYDARGNMTKRTGPTGLVETWTYDAANNVLAQTDTTGVLTSYSYDTSGRVISEVKDGQQKLYIWNGDGTLASSSDPLGRLTAYSYDPLGRLLTQTSPGGGITSYEYDVAGRMTRMIPPRGNLPGANPAAFDMLYKYDKAGNQTNVQGPGVRTVSVYDDANRLITKTAADGGVSSYVYNAASEVTSMTGPDGGVTTYEYSNRGERISQVDPVGAKTTWTYDGAGRMITMVEPRGNVAGANPVDYQWTYGYDAVGRKISETDPLGRVSTTTYDALGRATNQTRPDGSTATLFDPILQERKVTTTDQAGRSNTTELDALGRVVKTIDARGFATLSTYDAVGNRISQTAPDGGITTWTYDNENRVTSMVDPRGNTPPALPAAFTTTYAYDIEGHQVSSTDPLGRVTQTVFDTAGRADTTTDPGGKVTNLAYDAVGRVRQVNQTGQGATKYTYDTAGNLRTRLDPLLRTTAYDYDLGRRLVKQTDPAGRFSTFGYDLEGRRTLMVDQKANAAANPALGSTSYTYDRLGRVLTRAYSDGTATVSYTYDAAGRRATMVDGTGTTSYGYDSANRVVSKTLPSGAVMAYTYDAGNNVLTAADGSGGTATRTYDQVGRLKTVADEAGNVTTYGYDPAGFLVSTVMPGGIRQDRVVDAAGQIGQIANAGSAGLIRSFQYTRDVSGNPTAVIVNGPAGVVEGESQLFTYDNANRLRRACWTAVVCRNANQTAWTYDVVGKRLTEKVGAAPAKAFSYDPQTDQLTQTVDGTKITNFVYDANGNQLENGFTVSTFNAANQTVSVTEAAIGSTYTYDGDGLRVSDTLNQFGTLATTRFDWDTVSSSLANVVAESRSNGAGVNNNRFTYGLGLVSSEASDYVRSFGLTDPLGTLTQTSAVDGAIRWNGSTSPFGELHDETFAPGNTALYGEELRRYRFTGQYEAGFGLTYMRARNYNASLGAFTQTDPWPRGAGSVYEQSYAYGNNSPAVFVDPTGRRASGPALDPFCRQFRGDRPGPVWHGCVVTYPKSVTRSSDWVGPASDGDLTGHGIRDVLANFGLDTEVSTRITTSVGRIWKRVGMDYEVSDAEYVEILGRATSKVNLSLGSNGSVSQEDYSGGSPGIYAGVKSEIHLKRLRTLSPFKRVSAAQADQVVMAPPKLALSLFDWNRDFDLLQPQKWIVSRSKGPFLQWA
jgi:RHS repeat-associated protein